MVSKKSQIGSQDILARKSGREKRSRKPAPKSEFIVRRPLRMLEQISSRQKQKRRRTLPQPKSMRIISHFSEKGRKQTFFFLSCQPLSLLFMAVFLTYIAVHSYKLHENVRFRIKKVSSLVFCQSVQTSSRGGFKIQLLERIQSLRCKLLSDLRKPM